MKLHSILLVIFIIIANLIAAFNFSILNDESLSDYFLKNTDLPDKYSLREKTHLEEVKSLISLAFTILFVLSTVIKLDKAVIKQTSTYLMLFLLIILILALISFSTVFTYFHKLVFRTNTWILPENSVLIQTYPITFFYNTSLFIFLALIIQGIILFYYQKTIH